MAPNERFIGSQNNMFCEPERDSLELKLLQTPETAAHQDGQLSEASLDNQWGILDLL